MQRSPDVRRTETTPSANMNSWISPMRHVLALPLLALAILPACTPSKPAVKATPELQSLRNLGKAFYENPAEQHRAAGILKQAVDLEPESPQDVLNYGLALLRSGEVDAGVEQIQNAQQLDPDLPHTYWNLGIEYKKRGEFDTALVQLEKARELIPEQAKVWYNLGAIYRQIDRTDDAIAAFEHTIELDPSLKAPHFQLANIYRRTDREKAREELQKFQALGRAQENSAVDEDVEWSFYSELHDPIPARATVGEEAAVSTSTEPLTETGAVTALALFDANGDQQVDILASRGQALIAFLHEEGSFGDPTEVAAIEGIRRAAAGDINNDSRADVAVAAESGLYIVINHEEQYSALQIAKGEFRDTIFVDYDHDYDLDIVGVGTSNVVFRNSGDETFEQAEFPFVDEPGFAVTTAELFEDNGIDIVVAHENGVVHYDDRKLGVYEALDERPDLGLDNVRLQAIDADFDGQIDIVASSTDKRDDETTAHVMLVNDAGEFVKTGFLSSPISWADWANTGKYPEAPGDLPLDLPLLHGDFDGDGLVDAVTGAEIVRNLTRTSNNYATIALTGEKNNKLAEGARVEVKAGLIYRKQIYPGYPITFGLGGAEQIDTIRVTWPNGLIQNESEQPVNQRIDIVEKPRLSGSCPMVFTWNGDEFTFISEVLGVAPLGASLGDGGFFPVDHDEYVYISSDQLRPRDGHLEVRITEELREVAYLDKIRLIALDYPANQSIVTNEKFKGPPFPEFRLFGSERRIAATAATDHTGADVLELIQERDESYPANFTRDNRGRASQHSLTLDFPALSGRNEAVLVLHGWVDWSDASTFVSTAQRNDKAVIAPYLEMRDENGEWQTVLADMGLPAGQPRTIAVDVSDLWLSDSREVRITTNLCLYWDEAFALPTAAAPPARLTELTPVTAELDFRGFSALTVHPARAQPERFDYSRVSFTSNWNPTPGLYTRFGDVLPILDAEDDRIVIMGAGDELRLRFPANALPEVAEGHKRDYLLLVDGWAKEAESNTAFGLSVDPLPFHAMPGYPYPDTVPNHPAQLEEYREFLREYQTRPALRLIRPLN